MAPVVHHDLSSEYDNQVFKAIDADSTLEKSEKCFEKQPILQIVEYFLSIKGSPYEYFEPYGRSLLCRSRLVINLFSKNSC